MYVYLYRVQATFSKLLYLIHVINSRLKVFFGYIYIYIYVYMYLYVYTYVYMNVGMCIYVCVYMYIYVCVLYNPLVRHTSLLNTYGMRQKKTPVHGPFHT